MSGTQWELVSPVPADTGVAPPVTVGTRHPGKRLGFFSNRKHNAVVLGEEFTRLAIESGLADDVRAYEKAAGPGVPAPTDLLDTIARECDVVIVGNAD